MPARILVIEDNKANLDLMIYLLKSFGHTTLVAWDGEAGLELVEREQPDLVICDIELPKMGGNEIARRLKSTQSLRHIPLIAVTAFAMVDDRDKVMAAGFDGYIPKPIEPELFVGQVEAFLSSAQASAGPVRHDKPTEEFSRIEAESKNVNILVVDNSPENLHLMQSLLEPQGYHVTCTRSVSEALNIAHQHMPDLIISDLHMTTSGYEFLTIAKADAMLRRVPFVILSSSMRRDEDATHAMNLGAVRFIARPIEPEILLAEIEACLQ